MVVEHVSLMTTMSDYRQNFIGLKFRDRVSVADAIVLVHRFGLTKAAAFVSEVDPWRYPHDDTPATLNVKKYVQTAVDVAAHTCKDIQKFTDASISEYLCSPLLIKKGDRPRLVLKPRAQQINPSPKAVDTAAATFARKPSSQPVDLPTFKVYTFRSHPITSPPHPITRVLIIVVLLDAYM